MAPYIKTATTHLKLNGVPRNVTEDLRIAFQQPRFFWQVSCAKSQAKAPTEISHWTIVAVVVVVLSVVVET